MNVFKYKQFYIQFNFIMNQFERINLFNINICHYNQKQSKFNFLILELNIHTYIHTGTDASFSLGRLVLALSS